MSIRLSLRADPFRVLTKWLFAACGLLVCCLALLAMPGAPDDFLLLPRLTRLHASMTAPAGAGYILVGMAMVLLALRHFRIAGACGLLALAVAAASLRDGAIESGVAAPILREMALSGSGDGAGRGYGYTDPVTSTALGLAALSVLMVCATIGGRFPKRSSGQPSGGIPPGHPVGSSVDDVLEAMPRGLGGQTSFRELLAVLFASVVLALGSMALIGYMSGIETALSWRPSTMALPAAIASTAIGLGIVAFLLGQARTALPLWLALPFGVGFIAITLSLVHNVQRYEDQRFRQNLKIEARFLATQIDLHLGDLFLSLDRMADRWSALGDDAKRTWKRDAEAELKAYPFATAVEWIDAEAYPQWIVPETGRRKFRGLKLDSPDADAEESATFLRAKETGAAQITKTMPLWQGQGDAGFLRFTPLYAHDRFDGAMACVINPRLLLQHISSLHLYQSYALTLRDGAELLFTNLATHDARESDLVGAWSKTVKLDLPGRDWTLTVTPTPGILAEKNSLLPVLVLGSGLTISFVVAFLIFLTLKWRAMSRTLRDRGDRLRSIMNNTVEGIITINSHGIIETFNPACEVMFGIGAREAIGNNVSILMPQPYASEHDRHMRRYAETGEARVIGKGREVEGLRRDGSVFPLDLSVNRFESRGQVMFCGILRDISERKHFHRLQEEFAAIVSHELRTPLTCIRGAIGLVAHSCKDSLPKRDADLMRIALRNAERLGRLINDIVDTEKIKSGKMPLAIEPIDVADLLRQALEDNAPLSATLNIPFVLVKPPPPGIAILADHTRMLQIFSNLLSNAAKFSRAGSEVQLSVEQIGSAAKFMVRDFGIGIPEDFRPHIFSKFEQSTSSTRQGFEGSGLGLLITKALVENMGGTLSYSSEPGKGTTFVFDLPCAGGAT